MLVGVSGQRVAMEQVGVDALVQLPQLQLQLWRCLWRCLRSSPALAAGAQSVPRPIAQELQSLVERQHSRTPTHQRWHLTASEHPYCVLYERLPLSCATCKFRNAVRSGPWTAVELVSTTSASNEHTQQRHISSTISTFC